MAKLFINAGVIALTAFISPLRADRQRVRQLVGESDFIEVFCDCPLEVCETRDVKGLYKKARRGEIKEFTGISSPYEVPERPDAVLHTGRETLEECVEKVINVLRARDIIRQLEVSG